VLRVCWQKNSAIQETHGNVLHGGIMLRDNILFKKKQLEVTVQDFSWGVPK
jgi:hypothetical protein